MKKVIIPIALILCIGLIVVIALPKQNGSLDNQSGDSSKGFFDKLFEGISNSSTYSKEPEIDIFSEPQIVLYETNVELENRYDYNGNLIGYYRSTLGANCDNKGVVLFEILDLDNNVINSYMPQFAGKTLYFEYYGEGRLVSLWESDYNPEKPNSNIYYFLEGGNGHPYAYNEIRNGATTRFDIYNKNGEFVKAIAPVNSQNKLSVCEARFENSEGYYFIVSEYVRYKLAGGLDGMSIDWGTNSRMLYYDSNWNLRCEIEYDYVENNLKTQLVTTGAKVKNALGKVIRTYERAGLETALDVDYGDRMGYELTFYYTPETDCLQVYNDNGYDDVYSSNYVNFEYIDLSENKVLLKLEKTYQDGNKFITEFSYRGGYLIATASAKGSRYSKVEIYDNKGNLKEIVEASAGELLKVDWAYNGEVGFIEFYDTEGNSNNYYEANGETYSRTVYFGQK